MMKEIKTGLLPSDEENNYASHLDKGFLESSETVNGASFVETGLLRSSETVNGASIKPVSTTTNQFASARDRILQAAYELFVKNGFRGTTTQQIARKAVVNEVTLFRLFSNKQKLLSEVLREFIIEQNIMSINEDELFEKYSSDAKGFFMELSRLSCSCMKNTMPFMRMQLQPGINNKLNKETLEKLIQIPLMSKQKLTSIFQKAIQRGWIAPRETMDALFISFYGPFFAFFMNRLTFEDKVFPFPEDEMIEAMALNFVEGCLL